MMRHVREKLIFSYIDITFNLSECHILSSTVDIDIDNATVVWYCPLVRLNTLLNFFLSV
jgi:hypothetical protein